MSFGERRVGLEQEFFLVDEAGMISNRADEFLETCHESARAGGVDLERFLPECARHMVEVNTPPARSFGELAEEYLGNLQLAIGAGHDLGLRLYPLATYPLHVEPSMRDEPRYEMQARAVGRERFLHAGRCAGVHLHLEVEPGTVNKKAAVSYGCTDEAREELLNAYNLGISLDATLVALSRSCPFYEGHATGIANRTCHYRGDAELAPHGVYANLTPVGGLPPYARSAEGIVADQFDRFHAWLETLDRTGVGRQLFFEEGGGLLNSSGWNPVRLNKHGTVELRGIDSTYPGTVLTVCALAKSAADRVRREGLTVWPQRGQRTFEVADGALLVPDFDYAKGELFREAATGGVESPAVAAYLDSLLDFCGDEEIATALKEGGRYRTVEGDLVRKFPSMLSEDEGLQLVRGACDGLEREVTALAGARSGEAMAEGG